MPKVSVCVPAYNYARYIGECIRSVLAQTYQDWELIVVDNHSTDKTADVVRTFSDPRIRLFENPENIGLVGNWNRCISLASGGYVAILPADDVYLPRMLERSTKMLDEHPRMGFTYSSYEVIDDQGSYLETRQQWAEDKVLTEGAAIRSNVINANFAIPPTVLMRQACYKTGGGFDPAFRFIIDWALYMRVALAFDAGYIAEPLARHRYQHSSSVSAQTFVKNPRLVTEEEIRLLKEILPRLPPDPEWRRFRRDAYRGLVGRHVSRSYGLLAAGRVEEFRSQLAYAAKLDPALPFKYRKMATLWAVSLLSPTAARRLDSVEQSFWRAFRGASAKS